MIPYAVTIDYMQPTEISITQACNQQTIPDFTYENISSKFIGLECVQVQLEASQYILNYEEQKAMKRALLSSSVFVAKGKLIN